MNKITLIFNFILLYSLLFGYGVFGRISNKRRCADSSCSQPLSLATSLLRYAADDDRLLSFPHNVKAKIFSKEAGDNPTLWEAEEDNTNKCLKENYHDICLSVINGKRGYVPKNLFKEIKLFVKSSDVNVVVSTGRDDDKNQNITENKIVENNNRSTSTVTETPALPLANSKGLFSMIGGVSADSVPPNSPEISPQTTGKYEVFDGTTVYDDPASASLDKPPDIVSEVKQTPPIAKPPYLKQSPTESSKVKPPLEGISSFNSFGKPELTEVTKENQQQNEETSEKSIKAAENANESQKVETQSKSNVRSEFAEEKKDDLQTDEENSILSTSAENASENQELYYQPNNVQQEIAQETKHDMQNKDETRKTMFKPNDITNESQQSEHQAGMFSDIVNKVTNFISSGTGAVEENEEEEEDDKEEEDDSSVVVEDLGSGDNEETTSQEESGHRNALPVNNVEEKFTQAKSQPFKSPEDVSEVPAVREVVQSNLKPIVKAASSILENSPDEAEVEVSRSGISDSEDEEYLSGENFQEFLSGVSNVEESAIVVNNTSVGDIDTSKESQKKQETPVLIAIPVVTDTSDLIRPVPSEKHITDEEEQNPTTETKTSKPIDILHPALPSVTELSPGKEDETENISQETSPVKELNVFVNNNENYTDSAESGITLTSVEGNTTEPSVGVDPKEILFKPVHEEPESQFLPEEKGGQGVPSDLSAKTYDSEIDESKQAEHTNDESVSPAQQVDLELNNPVLEQIPTASSTPSPIRNILSFQHSSQLPSTYAPVVDDSLVVPADGVSEETVKSLEESDYPSSAVDADSTTEAQSEEYVDKVTQEPITEYALSDHSEDEAKVVEISSSLPAETSQESKQGESSEEGMFSWLNPVFDIFSSSQPQSQEAEQVPSVIDEVSLISEQVDPFHISKPKDISDEIPKSRVIYFEESCLADGLGEEACKALKNVPMDAPEDENKYTSLYSTDISSALDLLEKIPLETTLWLIITAVVVLIFSLGHYYIEAHRRDGPLVAIINKLEREVLILKKESSILDDRLHTAQEQLEAWNTNSSENDALIIDLKEELERIRADKAELEEQAAMLEREVETVTESGLEMHRLLSESLSSQDGSQVLLSTVESLREKLEHQEDEISSLSQSLYQKDVELEELKDKLGKAKVVASELENKVIDVVRAKDEEALELKEKHRLLIAQLEEVMETKALDETRVSMEMSKLSLTMKELQKCLAEKESELEEVKEVVKQLRSTDSNEKMDALFDVVGVRAQLKQAATDRDTFREKFHEEEGARKLLEGHMKKITQEVSELKNSFETAEKEKIEALTKLQVLSNYFKEKESQLQKELGVQESMWLHKQSDDHSIYEQMRSLREENEKFKGENTTTVAPPQPKPRLAEVKTKKKSNSVRQTQGLQNESLKKEIVEQEASFKIQVANVEQKAHENWVTSRQAERRLKEVQQEAAQLRNRLTIEKSNFSLDDSKQNLSETNGDPSSPPPSLIYPPTASPPFMMYPHMAPPGDFIPPPPLTGSSPYPSDSRPPPLGRISSPPLDHRFSPPPPLPYPPYDYPPYGHHSPSPPPPIPSQSHHRNVHKPKPREMSREQKDHSNYSPDTDKPMRRNKR